jgi:cardiolipin synthase
MELLTAANQLTLLRIALVPVFVLCLMYAMPGWALAVFLIAALTDLFDGLIARRSGHPTTVGAWLDPVADKLLLVTMFVMLSIPGLNYANRLPVWLTVLVISRDVGIVVTVAVVNLAVARRTFRPSLLGKAATLVYIVTGVYALFENVRGETSTLIIWLEYVCLVLTVASGLHYLFRVAKLFGGAPGFQEGGPSGPPGSRA